MLNSFVNVTLYIVIIEMMQNASGKFLKQHVLLFPIACLPTNVVKTNVHYPKTSCRKLK